jgi:hypothetical protein
MTVPGIVDDALGGEEVLTRVSLSGDDELFVTPRRTLAYRAGGVLSDESVSGYPHDVAALRVREGRRKAAIVFEYPVEDAHELSVSKGDLEGILQPLLASVLRATGATDPDERVRSAFRFSELTIVVTGERLFKHVGSALWDDDFESFHFEDVTGLDYEAGDVATGIVLTVAGRKERIKASNDRVPAIRNALESALFSYHGVDAADELGPVEAGSEAGRAGDGDDPGGSVAPFGEGIDPLSAGEDAPSETSDDADPGALLQSDPGSGAEGERTDDAAGGGSGADASGASGRVEARDGSDAADDGGGTDGSPATPFTESFEPSPEDRYEELSAELAELRETVERQNELLAKQQRAIERLVEELRD